MATLKFGTVLDAIRTDLEAQANLSGVKIRVLPQDPTEDPKEGISFDRVQGVQDFLAMGHSYEERIDVDGRIWAIAGETGDETGTASRDRAIVLLEEIVTVLEETDNDVYASVLDGRIPEYEYQPVVLGDGSVMAVVAFTLTFRCLV